MNVEKLEPCTIHGTKHMTYGGVCAWCGFGWDKFIKKLRSKEGRDD